MEQTFMIIKPDGVKKGLEQEIRNRIEKAGFTIEKWEKINPERDAVAIHYEEHKDKPFYNELIDYLCSGPVVKILISGLDAVSKIRALAGKNDEPGTIRGDYATSICENVVHTSDSLESAKREIKHWFK